MKQYIMFITCIFLLTGCAAIGRTINMTTDGTEESSIKYEITSDISDIGTSDIEPWREFINKMETIYGSKTSYDCRDDDTSPDRKLMGILSSNTYMRVNTDEVTPDIQEVILKYTNVDVAPLIAQGESLPDRGIVHKQEGKYDVMVSKYMTRPALVVLYRGIELKNQEMQQWLSDVAGETFFLNGVSKGEEKTVYQLEQVYMIAAMQRNKEILYNLYEDNETKKIDRVIMSIMPYGREEITFSGDEFDVLNRIATSKGVGQEVIEQLDQAIKEVTLGKVSKQSGKSSNVSYNIYKVGAPKVVKVELLF